MLAERRERGRLGAGEGFGGHASAAWPQSLDRCYWPVADVEADERQVTEDGGEWVECDDPISDGIHVLVRASEEFVVSTGYPGTNGEQRGERLSVTYPGGPAEAPTRGFSSTDAGSGAHGFRNAVPTDR